VTRLWLFDLGMSPWRLLCCRRSRLPPLAYPELCLISDLAEAVLRFRFFDGVMVPLPYTAAPVGVFLTHGSLARPTR
jgi:hypothetical protein